MNTSLNHGSAKIYQFPVGGRSGVSGSHQDETKTAADLASSRVSEVAVGGAWYHEAAIQESNPVRESGCRQHALYRRVAGVRHHFEGGKRVGTETFRPFFRSVRMPSSAAWRA